MCFFCKKFEEETLKDPIVIELLEKHFISLKINARKEAALARMYRIPGTQTILVRLPDGTSVNHRLWKGWHSGFMEVGELREYLSFVISYLEAEEREEFDTSGDSTSSGQISSLEKEALGGRRDVFGSRCF